VTKASHDQWALARRGRLAHIQGLEAGVRTIAHRLSLPVGQKGSKGAPGGYRSRREWHAKTRRLHVLEDRLQAARADWKAGRVRVVRGGKRLLNTRHHLQQARLSEERWRARWRAERRFLQADGESGKRYGNETIRVTPAGEVSIKLPAPLAHLANAPHGRYVLSATVAFAHRGEQWRDRVAANRAVAYRIHEDTACGGWYLTASWTIPPVRTVPLAAARARGMAGVNTNADHLAAWRLDAHGNPVGQPRRFAYELTGTAAHRDAQIRHALIRLLHWAARHGLTIAIEDLASRRRPPARSTAAARSSATSSPACRSPGCGPGSWAWPPNSASPSWLSTPPTPRSGAPSTGRNPSPPQPGRPAATTQQPWRSAGAPWDMRSGDGRHRPHSTGVMLWGIGPSRPHQ
jgi:hypothetical protein